MTVNINSTILIRDVCCYLNNWAGIVIIRHKEIRLIEEFARYSKIPVINAMTNINHPCEILADMYSLSKTRDNFVKDKYLFCGKNGNIGMAWKEASRIRVISFIIGGIIITGICIATKGTPCLLSVLGILATLIVIDVFLTYKVAKKNGYNCTILKHFPLI